MLDGALGADVAVVLGLEHLDEVVTHDCIPATLDVHTLDRLAPDHAKVELVRILAARLLAQLFDPILLGVEIARSLDVVRVLLEQAQLLPHERLRALAVLALLQVELSGDHPGGAKEIFKNASGHWIQR